MHLLLPLVVTATLLPFDPVGSARRVDLAQDRQSGADPLLSRLAGRWTGTGIVLNQPSTLSMTWSWELGGQFLRLTFRNEMGAAPKGNVFEAHAYYRTAGEGRYRGMWFDNAGMFRPLEARRDGDALSSSDQPSTTFT